ncbi:MAG: DUF1501 domain-containing protein [Planctomycetes bacterium]|nr:DUF1501 domain-containing protein [Planctomycetota bacterium]
MSTSVSRRRFLQSTLGSSALVSMGFAVPSFLARSARALAAEGATDDRVLVVVQLSGGNDGLNTVIPYADPAYRVNRVALRIAENTIIKVADGVGLHPTMTGFSEQLEAGRLAIVQGVGYPNPNRSHFESMDIWHSGRPEEKVHRTGWLGRMLDAKGQEARRDVPALFLGPNELPLALAARDTAVPAINSLEAFRLRTTDGSLPLGALRQLASAKRADEPSALDFIRRSTLAALDSSEKVQESLASAKSPVEYPAFGMAQRLHTIAQLIDAGLKTPIYYVALDGFDTHAGQADAHSALLNELASSVGAFMKDLAARGQLDRVLVMSFSEFGRRVKENGSAGTDHGAAAPMFVLGSKVQSGLVGKHPSLTDQDEGDLKHHTDFRQVYAAILDDWLGVSSETVLGKKFEHAKIFKA